jgi:hypothetical protein
MPVDEFIISVFCWVEKNIASVVGSAVKLRQRGHQPRLSDAEVITMEVVGEFLGYDGDKAIWSYFRRHWQAWFPGLGGRTSFLRQATNLWHVKQRLHEWLLAELGADGDDCYLIDGFPMPVCKLVRAARSQVFKAEAACGYCAAKDEYYYGLKGHVVIDLRGAISAMTVTAANCDERDAAYDMLSVIEGLLIGDKGYIRPQFKADCEALGIDLQTPVRKNMTEPRPRWFLRLLQRVRKRVETVISQLEQRFGLAIMRARDPWHLTNRVARKILAHTFAVSLNQRLGREPLQFDELVID